MLGWTSRRLAAQTHVSTITTISGAGFAWFGLFNNGIQGEWLLLRDLRASSGSASNYTTILVQGTSAGTLYGAGVPLDPSAPVLAGQTYSGHLAGIPSAVGANSRLFPPTGNTLQNVWTYDRPIAYILPGYMFQLVNNTTGGTLLATFEWLVVDPKELS